MNALGKSIIKPNSLPATPIDADATIPSEFATAELIINEAVNTISCKPSGNPIRMICLRIPLSIFMLSFPKWKGSPFFFTIKREMITLMPCAATVAIAAPAAAIWKTATRRRSPAILITHAMATVISGVLESPMPRNIDPQRL